MLSSFYACVWAPCLMNWVIKTGNCGPKPVCALLWLIEESEKGSIRWLLKQHFFSLFFFLSSGQRERRSRGKPSRTHPLPFPPGGHGALVGLEKSFKKLNVREARAYAAQTSRFVHSLSASWDTCLPSEHQQLSTGFSQFSHCSCRCAGPAACTRCVVASQGWGQQRALQEHHVLEPWTNRYFTPDVTKLLLVCTKGLAHFKICPF